MGQLETLSLVAPSSPIDTWPVEVQREADASTQGQTFRLPANEWAEQIQRQATAKYLGETNAIMVISH